MAWKPLNKRVLVKALRTDSLLDLRAAGEQAVYTGEGIVLEKADDAAGVEIGDHVLLPQMITRNPMLGEDTAILFLAELLAVKKKD